jgi:hypothetical protein
MIILALAGLIIFSATALVTGLSFDAKTVAPSVISALLAAATAPAWKLYQAENIRAREFDRDLVRLEEIRVTRAIDPKKAPKSSRKLTAGPISIDSNGKPSMRDRENE